MSSTRLGMVFAALLVVAMVAFAPLGAAISIFGMRDAGLAARAATGTIWSGRLRDARLGRFAVGDADVALDPLALFTGSAKLSVTGMLGSAIVVSSPSETGVERATAKIDAAGLFGPVPISGLDFEAVGIKFHSGRCAEADGRIRATFAGDIAGLSLAQGLSGAIRCDAGLLLVPLVSQSALERLNLRISGDGSYRAEFIIASSDPALTVKLAAAGFVSAQGGQVLRITGSF